MSYARSALIEARRVRPDLFLSNLTTSFASYTAASTIPISDDYLLSMVDYVVHRAELRDDEFAVDLSMLLEDNPILYKVDISRNPIGPSGG